MADRLKDLFFTESFVSDLGNAIHDVWSEFDVQQFRELVFTPEWKKLELKQKMRHISGCLHKTLPEYAQALQILLDIAGRFSGFNTLLFSDYVECYGLEDRQLSLPALRQFTKLGSAEFAIRPFLMQNLDDTLSHMQQWAEDADAAVRRLASEGCRPRLPWAMDLPPLKKDPRPILPILEKLKNDPSETVRRSVANNLNDISKDHAQLVLDICERWSGQSPETDRLIKHACRGLLKTGDTRAMRLFGFEDPQHICITQYQFSADQLRLGEELHFSFTIGVRTDYPAKLRLEYIVQFVKAKGNLSAKVFQIREGMFEPGSHTIRRKHLFKDHSTRTHFPGIHHISIIVNGVEKANQSIELIK